MSVVYLVMAKRDKHMIFMEKKDLKRGGLMETMYFPGF